VAQGDAATLLNLTGDLFPTPATTPADLLDVRKTLTAALLGGQSPIDVALRPFVGEPAGGAEEAIQEIVDNPPPASTNRVLHRTTAIPPAVALSGGPAWQFGQVPARTIGPFQDRGGRPHWFDVFTPSAFFRVYALGEADPIALLPAGTAAGPAGFILPGGTVWLRARYLSAAARASAWAGLHIDNGTAKASGPGQATPGAILLRIGAGLQLSLTLSTGGLPSFPANATFSVSGNGIRPGGFGPGSVTAFGATVPFSPAAGAPDYVPEIRAILAPLTSGVADFEPADTPLSGFAPIHTIAWALPVTDAPFASLAEAEGPGSIALILDPGVEASMANGNVVLNRATVLISPQRVAAEALTAQTALAPRTLDAWYEERSEHRSGFELRYPSVFPFWYVRLADGAEAFLANCELTLHIERPLRASGARLESRISGTQILEQDAAGTRLMLTASQSADPTRRYALALSNGLLTVAEANAIELFGNLKTPTEVVSGSLAVGLPLFFITPTLPDPYAANFDPRANNQPSGDIRVTVSVIWTEPFAVEFDIRLDPRPSNMQALASVLPAPVTFRAMDALTARYKDNLLQQPDQGLCLLDVSSNSSQFGIALGFGDQPGGGLVIQNQALSVGGSNATIFLLPQFQWEPFYNRANPKIPGDAEGWRYFPNDGGPTQAAGQIVDLVPVRPLAVLDATVNVYARRQGSTNVLFTLPFGIRGVALLNPLDGQFQALPQLSIAAPRFAGFDAAPQISIIAGTLADGQTWIAGQAQQVDNLFPSPPPNTLGAYVGGGFNTAFLNGLPLERIGLSGYGANLFSRWYLAKNADIGITQAAMDAWNGRTAHECIMFTSFLLPCFARMVRTITLDRRGGGAVVRYDSGWVPTTPGLFDYLGRTFHKCAMSGIYNLREVRDTDYVVTLSNGVQLQAVYYDGDVAMENPVRGADAAGRVTARRHLGFIQLLTIPPAPPVGPITADVIDAVHLAELFSLVGPLGGPLDCAIRIGNSQHEMKVANVFAANASADQFSVGPFGSPVLNGPGAWSVVRMDSGTGAVESVHAARGVPLVRAINGPYRWADPADLFQNNPSSDYGFLFSSGAQRVLFRRPKIEPAATQISSAIPPLLADPYALLKPTGLFPPPAQAIPFDQAGWGLDVAGGTLQLSPTPFIVKTVGQGFNILKTAEWASDLAYRDAVDNVTKFTIDSASGWAIDSTGIRQALTFPILGEVMKIVHTIHAPTGAEESFPNPQFVFSPVLDAVSDVLRMLREWAPDLPQPLTVNASFSGSTLRLSAVADFLIQDSDGNAIECGMGKLKGDLKLGADVSVDIATRVPNGAIFFEVTGSWQQEVFPLIYGGGLMRFSVRGENSGKATLELDACVTGSIGGDVIPGLVSLEATVKYGYFLFTNPLLPGFMAGIEGRAKLVSGLLGFKLTVEGRIGITRTTHNLADAKHICSLHGEILVAGTVTAVWVVDERKSFRTQFDVNVDWKMLLLAAKAGLLPVP
jgi:hypothetical protein